MPQKQGESHVNLQLFSVNVLKLDVTMENVTKRHANMITQDNWQYGCSVFYNYQDSRSTCIVKLSKTTKYLMFCLGVYKTGCLLRFVKGGNKFAIAGGCHLVNVSQGMIGARWMQEEWKPNMAVFEVSVVLDERKCSNHEHYRFDSYLNFPVYKL